MLKNRLKKLEKSISTDGLDGRQFVGRFYDELSEDERYLWLKYHNSLVAPNADVSVSAFEEIYAYLSQSLHFKCGDRPKPPTQEELKRRIAEVESEILKGDF